MARASSSASTFVTVRSEGGLLPPDLLARIAQSDRELSGLRSEGYGLPRGERLNEAASRAWTNVRAYWAAFQATSGSLLPGESGVTETREQWIIPLFRELGYGRLSFRSAAEEVGGQRYAISHRAGEGSGPEAPPVHVISFRYDLDRAIAAGAGSGGTGQLSPLRISPHGLVQDYLNRTDHLWGVVTNGRRLRLLRDNLNLSRAAFVEFDLETMLEEGIYADFVLLYLLLHRTRLASPGVAPRACWLEQWREDAVARGTRALDTLREGVEAAIRSLGQGLLEHPGNETLRARLMNGRLTGEGYYRQLLRLVYRLLFLLAAEERDLLFPPGAAPEQRSLYTDHYSIGRLRELVGRRRAADRHDDLWRSLLVTFAMLRDEDGGGDRIGLPSLGGGLFDADACSDLDGALVANERLLAAIRGLAFAKDSKTGLTRRVNYRDMDVEELGSVYEGLLELQPVLRTAGERPEFSLGASGERKSTGSYYTNAGLVRELIASALDPVIAAALARGKTREEQRANLLALKICDPACGSGHFLLAAARRLGRELARLTQEEAEPDPMAVRATTRLVIARCIYGVDRNPLAVDLCKLALWLEGHEAGRPLSFLEAHIKWGNSLVGATNELMEGGIPDAAFEPVTGDDKKIASIVRRDNKKQSKDQYPLGSSVTGPQDKAAQIRYFADLAGDDSSTAATRRKKQLLHEHETALEERRARLRADLWTAAFFWPLRADVPDPPTHGAWLKLLADDRLVNAAFDEAGVRDVPLDRVSSELMTLRYARTLAREVAFFHWPLEFKDIFARPDPGFDCILGNPPWERVKLQEQEFFAARSPEIAKAPNAAARNRAIAALQETNPGLYGAFERAKSESENESHFLRRSERFPLTGRGDVNTYSVFAEQMARSLSTSGRAGIIVPTGIATDDTNKAFFSWLVRSGRLVSLFGFENEEFLFQAVHHAIKFCLLTVSGAERGDLGIDFVFYARQPDQVYDTARRFTLASSDIQLLNPNTHTCPIFRSTRDAELTKAIYRHVPVLARDVPDNSGNPWNVEIGRMFHTSDDSALFIESETETSLRLYEAKCYWQFDHRYATWDKSAQDFREVVPEEKCDPSFTVQFRYNVERDQVPDKFQRRLAKWYLSFRRITSATNERTLIASITPESGLLDSGNNIYTSVALNAILLGACLNSFVADFCARQKLNGSNMSVGILSQLPILPPSAHISALVDLIVPRALELIYTAQDLAPFARDCGYDGPPFVWDEERRAQLRADLDGVYAHLYGLPRDDFAYILDTFPVVRQKDEKRWGEYRTKRLCLEAYDRFGPLVAAARATESVPAREAVNIPQVDSIAVSTPPARPQSEPHAAPLVSMPTDVVVEVPSLPGLVSPRVTGADRYTQAAALAVVASRGRGDFNFGRLKLVKELYFIQEHLGLDLRLDFVREAHGPLDPAVYKVESLAEKQGWLRVYGKRGERASYQAGPKIGGALQQIQKRLGPRMREVEELLVHFRSFDTRRIEQWATLHQVWHDRRAQRQPLTSGAIVAEVRAWKPDRPGFAEGALRHELDEMVRAGLISLDQ